MARVYRATIKSVRLRPFQIEQEAALRLPSSYTTGCTVPYHGGSRWMFELGGYNPPTIKDDPVQELLGQGVVRV